MVSRAESVIAALRERRLTLATAESLTGGLVCAALTDIPGASAVICGGVVSYATEIKVTVLGVDRALTEQMGAVDPEVARQMAIGAARVLSADIGLSCTGVAGPDPQDGHDPGLVYVAICDPTGEVEVVELHLTGSRDEIRLATVEAALELVLAHLRSWPIP
jgi:nicotinamide-nucleotide amidase